MPKVNVNTVNLKRVRDAFTEMNNEKGLLGLALLDEIDFQKETLAKMRKNIESESITSEYNGYQRSNPIIAGYNAMINNYSKLVRQAVELLPKETEIEDNFDDFIED